MGHAAVIQLGQSAFDGLADCGSEYVDAGAVHGQQHRILPPGKIG